MEPYRCTELGQLYLSRRLLKRRVTGTDAVKRVIYVWLDSYWQEQNKALQGKVLYIKTKDAV